MYSTYMRDLKIEKLSDEFGQYVIFLKCSCGHIRRCNPSTLAAFAGWDVAGAKWFGYPTFWVNRSNAAVEQLGVVPDGVGSGMADLVKFVLG